MNITQIWKENNIPLSYSSFYRLIQDHGIDKAIEISKKKDDELEKLRSLLQEFPHKRYTKYQLFNVIYNAIGNDVSDYHIRKIIQQLLQCKFLLKNNGEYFINSKH